MRLSNSKIKTWRRCPKQYQFKYIRKLEPKLKGIQLERGSWIHELLQYYYDGEDWIGRHKELTKEFYSLFEEEREHLGDMPQEVTRIMRSYMRKWAKKDRARYRTVDVELDEILTLPTGDEFNFIIDLIVEDLIDGGLWLWDHKTVKSFMDPDFLLIDAQLTRYFWAAEVMGYTPLRGVMFNEIRTKAPAVPAELRNGGLSQRKNIDTDYFTYMREIKRRGLDPYQYDATLQRLKRNSGKFFRRTPLPKDKPLTRQQMVEMIYSASEMKRGERLKQFPRTPSKECNWDCSYKELCIVELMGGNIQPMIKANFKRRSRHAS